MEQGIAIHERVPIPEELIPEDSRVEIDAKIHAGYCESLWSWYRVMKKILIAYHSYHWEGYEYGRIVRGPGPCLGRRRCESGSAYPKLFVSRADSKRIALITPWEKSIHWKADRAYHIDVHRIKHSISFGALK